MNGYVHGKYFLCIQIFNPNKNLRNSEIWVYNNECSIYVIYYFFVNQILICKKSSNDT
jgi:hypothetical protein